MKSFPKILIIFFLAIFIFQLACLLFLSLAPIASQAADIQFKPQVQIPGYAFDPADKTTGNIANLVRAIYKYAIGIVGILAAVVLMIGGVMWIVAGGNATAIGEAKAWIGASLTGLLLALMSYLILATVNPALVDLKTTPITPITPLQGTITTQGCCVPVNNSKACFTGSKNDAGKSLCNEPDNNFNSTPCNQIAQCEQFNTTCDGTNNGTWCGDKTTQGCFNGRCEKCSNEGTRCGTIGGIGNPIFCCPGLKCDKTVVIGFDSCVKN